MTTAAAESLAGQAGGGNHPAERGAENDKGKPTEKPVEKPVEKMEKRRALGRGLESLLPGPRVVVAARPGFAPGSGGDGGTRAGVPAPHETELRAAALPTQVDEEFGPQPLPGETFSIQAVADTTRTPGNLVVSLAIDAIEKNPYQTRHVSEDEPLEELADSIRMNGVVQPVVVRPSEEKEGRYVLILGQRRCLASKLAGKTTVPAIVKRVSDQQAAEMTIVENLQREDLSPLEHAEAFRILSQKFGLTQVQIGERVGLSRESVSNYMRLLKLPEQVRDYMAEKKIGFAEARELLKLEEPGMIQKAADRVVKRRMPFDQIEEMVMQWQGLLTPVPGTPGYEKKASGARWVDPNVRSAQRELESLLGVRVRIKDRKGKGKIVIEYHSVEDYERVVGMLKKK